MCCRPLLLWFGETTKSAVAVAVAPVAVAVAVERKTLPNCYAVFHLMLM